MRETPDPGLMRLYAAGNVSACVFGPGYPAGGATLGPAITFGYLAGRHLTERAATGSTGHPRKGAPLELNEKGRPRAVLPRRDNLG